MKRPRLRIDGRPGSARWVDWHGKQRSLTARLSFVFWRGIVDHAAIGDPGPFEIRKVGGTWHRVEITQEEALEMLRTNTWHKGAYRSVLACLEARKRKEGSKA